MLSSPQPTIIERLRKAIEADPRVFVEPTGLANPNFPMLGLPKPAEPVDLPVIVDPCERPIGQQIAILKLRGGELAKKILAHLHEMSAPDPAKADWPALITEGLIVRRVKLELTPRGVHAASAIQRGLAKKFGVHHISYTISRFGSGHTARCTCGNWSTVAQRTQSGENSLYRAGAVHLSRVGQSPADRLLRCTAAAAEVRA